MPFLAMTQQRLGQSKVARRTLSELRHRIRLWETMTKVSRETGEASLISQAEEYSSFLREAEALIELDPCPLIILSHVDVRDWSGVRTSHPFDNEESPIMSLATNPAIESQ